MSCIRFPLFRCRPAQRESENTLHFFAGSRDLCARGSARCGARRASLGNDAERGPRAVLTDYFESSAGWAGKTRPTLERPSLYALAKRFGWSPDNPRFKIGMHVVVARRSYKPAGLAGPIPARP